MRLEELVKLAREDILSDTNEAKYLWETSALTRYAKEALEQACIRAPLINRSYTFDVVADTSEYTLNEFVRQISSVKLDLQNPPLLQKTEEDLTILYGSSWKINTGAPIYYVRKKRSLRLFPIPIVNDTMTVTTSILPDLDFYLDDDIDPVYQLPLMYYIGFKALIRPDADTQNPVKANEFLAMFNEAFGDKHTAKHDELSKYLPMYATRQSGRMA